MVKDADAHELSGEQTTRCKKQIAAATVAAVVFIAVSWWVSTRLGWVGA